MTYRCAAFWFRPATNCSTGIPVLLGPTGGTALAGTATSINLTTAWGINAGYEHFWSPQWRTSLYGGWTSVSYNSQANAILCSLQGDGSGFGTAAVANPGCNNNWSSWWVGSRTQWNVTKDFYMGLDVAYLNMNSMNTSTGLVAGGAIVPNGAINGTTTPKFVDDQNIWMARFRVHRDFYP